MRTRSYRNLLAGTVLVAGCALLLSGCLGFGGGSDKSTSSTVSRGQVGTTVASVADASNEPIVVSPADRYSSFQSKDPFVQQQESTTTEAGSSSSTTTPSGTTTTTSGSSTTTSSTSSTTTSTTSGSTSTTSTTVPATSTTSFYKHMIQVLSIVRHTDGSGAVTFQVDNDVCVDKVENDRVSTSWGEIRVVQIYVDSQPYTVTLVRDDGTTLTLSEHQIVFE